MNVKQTYKPIIFPCLLFLALEFSMRMFFFSAGNNSDFKIVRDILVVIAFIGFLILKGLLTRQDFKINLKILLPAVLPIILFMYLFTDNSGASYPVYFIFQTLVKAPIIEELICRKFILMSFYPEKRITGIIASNCLFILLHFPDSLSSLFFFLAISLFITVVQLKTKSIINVILLHSFCNLLAFLL